MILSSYSPLAWGQLGLDPTRAGEECIDGFTVIYWTIWHRGNIYASLIGFGWLQKAITNLIWVPVSPGKAAKDIQSMLEARCCQGKAVWSPHSTVCQSQGCKQCQGWEDVRQGAGGTWRIAPFLTAPWFLYGELLGPGIPGFYFQFPRSWKPRLRLCPLPDLSSPHWWVSGWLLMAAIHTTKGPRRIRPVFHSCKQLDRILL